jgi:hypothetical protein
MVNPCVVCVSRRDINEHIALEPLAKKVRAHVRDHTRLVNVLITLKHSIMIVVMLRSPVTGIVLFLFARLLSVLLRYKANNYIVLYLSWYRNQYLPYPKKDEYHHLILATYNNPVYKRVFEWGGTENIACKVAQQYHLIILKLDEEGKV